MVFFKKALDGHCKKRDRKATEQALRLAASRLFAEKGYENTRTLEIAKEAGANEALIGRYFGGKEGLLISIMKDEGALEVEALPGNECGKLDSFPEVNVGTDFKKAMDIFFKNGLKSFESCQEFIKIGASRALVDPEMAEVLRKKIIDQKLPDMVKNLHTYPALAKMKKADVQAIALLLMSVNFNMNFMGRRIYNMGDGQVDRALEILMQSLVNFVE